MKLRSHQKRCRSVALLLVPALTGCLVLADTSAARAEEPRKGQQSGLYVVQLADEPVATHEGTRSAEGRKPDPRSDAVRAYVARLDRVRDRVLATASGGGRAKRPRVLHEYNYAFNGFAAELTGDQAATLAALPGVVSVTRNENLKVTEAPARPAARPSAPLADTARFLGLSGPKGLWSTFPGGAAHAGEGMIIGVVDTGFDPANPMFQPLPGPRPDAEVIARKWRGGCDAGTDPDHMVRCNNKVIGAAYFNKGLTGARAGKAASPLDTEGHGTHTATTAAGAYGIPASTPPAVLGGTLSGVAPAARVAVYKVCWGDQGCPLVDIVAGVDKAVADGVDVINMSIGALDGSLDNPLNMVAFNAATAGVFFAAAAGNNGPGTVSNTAPWITTVAASSTDTGYRAALTLGDGTSFDSVGAGSAVPSSPLIDAADAAKAGSDDARDPFCAAGTLDPAKARGKIVICQRGGNGRSAKSAEVRAAGGVGMVLTNTEDTQELLAEVHSVPTVHVNATDATAIREYAAAKRATARLGGARTVPQRAPETAAFSSSGPDHVTHGDVLKPDLTAPGVDIAAGVVRGGTNGRFKGGFGLLSGTSMASPHVAGLALLIRAQHPDWSPMAIKSALMTTAYTTDTEGEPIRRSGADATPLDYGSGHVAPASTLDPGLVYDSTSADWTDFLCTATGPHASGDDSRCVAARKTDASDLNYPSIAVGGLTGRQTVTRTVTNVGSTRTVYKATVQTPAGFEARVTPDVLDLAPGASARFAVRFTQTDAVYDDWLFGSLTWSDAHGRHRVRSPLALQANRLDAPPEVKVEGKGSDGSVTLRPKVGWQGDLNTRLSGLHADTGRTGTLTGVKPDFSMVKPTEGPASAKTTVHVPEGTRLARLALLDRDAVPQQDLDLYVYKDGTYYTSSRSPTSEEIIDLEEPGDYEVYVNQWTVADRTSPLPFTLRTWLVGPDEPATATTLSPSTTKVSTADRPKITIGWRGLDRRRLYLGVVEYGENSAYDAGRTYLTVMP